MRSSAVILGICVSAVLLAAAGALHLLAQNNGGEQYRRSIDLVQEIRLLSSDWSIEIARVKSNPLADFDSLAAFIPRMAQLKEELSGTAQRIPDLPDRLASDIQAYLSAMSAREERIERFKTGYAVVRNSSRYLPIAAANVLRQAQAAGDEALARSVSGLIRDVNLFLATPTDASQTRLEAEIGKLRDSSVAYAPSLANALANLLSHAEVLVAKQGPTEELFAQATSGEISELTEQLSANFRFELGKQALMASWYDRGMLAAFAVLILFWVLLALQQRIRGGAARAAADPDPLEADAAAAEALPAAGDGMAVPESADGPAPVPAAALPVEPRYADAEAALQHGFVVRSIAAILAASAEEVSGRMDYLRRTQQSLRDVLANGEATELPNGAEVDQEMEAISAVALNVRQRMNAIADLARRLDAFPGALTNHVERGMIDLNTCVETAVAAAGAGSDVSIVTNFGEVPEVFASRTEFEVLIGELLENSLDAVRGIEGRKGIVKIDTVRTDDEILITVIDNGAGIVPGQRANVFKPFYTTHNGAMGIGLALAGHLAGKYGGAININSLPGQGTVARVALPAGIAAP